jgi:hypothetical protein
MSDELNSGKSLSENDLLREIYKKLAGDSPSLDMTKAHSKASLLRAIASVTKPIPLPDVPSGPSIVADIPTTLDPGQRVWCVATQSEWMGADPDNGIFPTLGIGKPWPVKGYKELHGRIWCDADTNWQNEIFVYSNSIGSFTAQITDPAVHVLVFAAPLPIDSMYGYASSGSNSFLLPDTRVTSVSIGRSNNGLGVVVNANRVFFSRDNASEETAFYYFSLYVSLPE